MRTNVSSDQKAKIVNQYWNGTPVKDLCEKYQVPRSTLYSWLKPYQNVYASRHATEAIATQKEYNDLKQKYDRQQQVLQAIVDSGCFTMIPLEERIAIYDQLSEHYGANILLDSLSLKVPSTTESRRIVCQLTIKGDMTYYRTWFTGCSMIVPGAMAPIRYCPSSKRRA